MERHLDKRPDEAEERSVCRGAPQAELLDEESLARVQSAAALESNRVAADSAAGVDADLKESGPDAAHLPAERAESAAAAEVRDGPV